MQQPSFFSPKQFDMVTKYALYAAVFLLPLFFLPFTSDPYDFNKQILLFVCVLVALFSWMLKGLIQGRVEVKKDLIGVALAVFTGISLLSTLFSLNKYGSFWGWPQLTSESFLTLCLFSLFYFLANQTFGKKEITELSVLLGISTVISELVSFVLFLFPNMGFGYATTMGDSVTIGLFAALMLPLVITLLMQAKRWGKVVFGLGVLLTLILCVMVNHYAVWSVLALGSAAFMMLVIIKKEFFDLRWLALPMFFLAVSLFFLILNPRLPWLPTANNDISLSQSASLNIAKGALSHDPILGSGPGTFSYDYLKFKDQSVNQTSLWNVIFYRGVSTVTTLLATTGILGALSFLVLLAMVLWYGIRLLFSSKQIEDRTFVMMVGWLASFAAFALFSLMYNSGLALTLVGFVLMVSIANTIFEEKKEFHLKAGSGVMITMVFVFTVLFIFGIGLFILDGQRYYAEVRYYQGVSDWQAGNVAKSVPELEDAARNNQSADVYFVQLAQAYLAKLQNDLAGGKLSQADAATEIQQLGGNAINAATIATTLNPQSANDWSFRGFVYQSLAGASKDTQSWAEKSYQQAIVLDPANPYLETQLGILYYQDQNYDQASTQLNEALVLNTQYAPAMYYLGLVEAAQGKTTAAVAEFTALAKIDTQDATTIQQIIANIQAGVSPLTGIGQSATSANPETQTIPLPSKTTKTTTK
jgi:tetratricopeptide (TPR) repeat protein